MRCFAVDWFPVFLSFCMFIFADLAILICATCFLNKPLGRHMPNLNSGLNLLVDSCIMHNRVFYMLRRVQYGFILAEIIDGLIPLCKLQVSVPDGAC